MNELVRQLSDGEHLIRASRVGNSVEEFHKHIDRGYIHIKFTTTRGGTELGVQLDPNATSLTQANFNHAKGIVHLEGNLTLNNVPVSCIADIDLATLEGKGCLRVLT